MDPIVQPDPLPICVSIPGGLEPNRFIVVDGYVPTNAAVGFSIRLQCGPNMRELDDIAVCFSISFIQKKMLYEVNSYLNKKWGKPEGSLRGAIFDDSEIQFEEEPEKTEKDKQSDISLELRPGDYCGILFECRENCFSISVKSKHVLDFKHRTEFTRITHFVLTGEFSVVQAGVMGGRGPTRWLIYATGMYQPWAQTYITVLNDVIFEKAVIQSENLWLILFYMNSCIFHNNFEFAATELGDKFRSDACFGVMDCLVNLDTVLRLQITKVPTVLYFDSGSKNWESAKEYDGEYTEKGFLDWILYKTGALCEMPMGKGTPAPQTRSIRMIERDSWMRGPPRLLSGAGQPLDGEKFSAPHKASSKILYDRIYHNYSDESKMSSQIAIGNEEPGPSKKYVKHVSSKVLSLIRSLTKPEATKPEEAGISTKQASTTSAGRKTNLKQQPTEQTSTTSITTTTTVVVFKDLSDDKIKDSQTRISENTKRK